MGILCFDGCSSNEVLLKDFIVQICKGRCEFFRHANVHFVYPEVTPKTFPPQFSHMEKVPFSLRQRFSQRSVYPLYNKTVLIWSPQVDTLYSCYCFIITYPSTLGLLHVSTCSNIQNLPREPSLVFGMKVVYSLHQRSL